MCKKSLTDTSLCHHSSEHRRRQSSYQITLLQVSFTHRSLTHRSQSACIGVQPLHLPVCSICQYMLTSLQTPSACLSSLLLQWTFTLGTIGKIQMVTQFRCACIKPCLHNEHAFMAIVQLSHAPHTNRCMHLQLLYSHPIPCTLIEACVRGYHTVITPHDASEHPIAPHGCTPFESRTPCLSLSSCAHAHHLAMTTPHAATSVTCFSADQIPSFSQCRIDHRHCAVILFLLRIKAHGGGVIYHEGMYYWYGENKAGSTYTAYSLG